MLFTDQELGLTLTGATVLDAWVSIQLLDKALKFGVITAQELDTISNFRKNIVAAIETSTGKNIDTVLSNLTPAPVVETPAV